MPLSLGLNRGMALNNTGNPDGGVVPPVSDYELREDGSIELREDGTNELRD